MADDTKIPLPGDTAAIAANLEKAAKAARDIAKANGDSFNYLGQAAENAEIVAAAAKKNLDLLLEGNAATERRAQLAQKELGVLERKAETTSSMTAAELERLSTLQQEMVAFEAILGLSDKQKASLVAQNQELVKQKNILNDVNASMKAAGGSMLGLVGMSKKFEQTMLGGVAVGMTKFLKNIEKSNVSFKELAGAGLNRFAGSFASFTLEVTAGMDALTAGAVKNTGANSLFVATLSDSAEQLRSMGLGFSDAGIAFEALYKNTTDFRNMTASAQQELTVFVATLSKAGIGAAQTSQMFESLSRTLNLGTTQAQEMTGEFVDLARALNMDVNKFLGDASQALETLASRGAQATDIVKDLGIMAQQTGVSMNNLIGVAQKFDTFAGAAESVGRLNGILGGAYLNSIDMVYATESERMELLHETLDLSGKSFEAMGHHEKQALATAAGFSNVADATKFFNQSMSINTAEMERNAAKQEKHADLARRSMDIFEELKMTMMSFAISFAGIFDTISLILGGLATANDFLRGWPAQILGLAAAFAMVIKLVKGLSILIVPMATRHIAALKAEGVAVSQLTAQYALLNSARMGGAGGFIGPIRPPAGGGGFMGKAGGMGKMARFGGGALLAAGGIGTMVGSGGDTGGMVMGGAMSGASIGGMINPGLGHLVGGGIGAAAGWIGSLFENGTDNTPAVPAIGVNEGLGGEIIAAPPASSVVNNRNIQGLTAGMLALNRNMMTQGPASGRQLANAVAQGMKQANKSDRLHNRGQIAVIDTQEKIISIDVPRDFRRA
jgi:hypothetical protein